MGPLLRIIVPATLLSIVLSCVGCVRFPTFGSLEGTDAGQLVGEFASKRPLRIGVATEADTRRVLGEPRYVSSDRRTYVYAWERGWARWLRIPVLDTKPAEKKIYAVEIQFNDAGIMEEIRRHTVKRHYDWLFTLRNLPELHDGRIPGRELRRLFPRLLATDGDPTTHSASMPSTTQTTRPTWQRLFPF